MKRRPATTFAVLALAGGLACCTAVLGDDFELAGSGGTTTTGTTTTTTTTGTGGGGGECTALADCDGLPGCETDLDSSVEHCGSCGHACSSVGADAVSCSAGTCVAACTGGYGDCTTPASPEPDDGCETLLGTPDNCGFCGHVCDGGCSSYDCDPIVIYGTAATGSVRDIELWGMTLFWADRQFGKVARVESDGTGYNELASSLLFPPRVATDGLHLYFYEDTGSLVRRVPVGGGTTQNMAGSSSIGIGVTGTWVYYGASNLYRKIKDPLASAETIYAGGINALHVSGTDVFFGTGSNLRHYNELNGTTNLLYSMGSGFAFVAIASDANNLYWIGSDNQVHQGARTGGGSTPIAGGVGLRDLAVGNGYVYFTDESSDAVVRAPIGGGGGEAIVTSVTRPYAIAVDSDYVYFSSILEGDIYRKALPFW